MSNLLGLFGRSQYGRGGGGGFGAMRFVIAAVIAGIALVSYYAKTQVNPVTGEKQRVALTVDQEKALGLQSAPQMVQQMNARVVDPARFLEIITSTSFNAPAYKSYGRLILEPPDKPTFTLTLGMKDIELALEAGGETRVPMPMAALIREQHLAAINQGYGDRDWAALGNYIARSAGL